MNLCFQVKLSRAENERLLHDESKKWFITELSERDSRIANARIEMVRSMDEEDTVEMMKSQANKEVAWTNERQRLAAEKQKAEMEKADADASVALLRKELDEVKRGH